MLHQLALQLVHTWLHYALHTIHQPGSRRRVPRREDQFGDIQNARIALTRIFNEIEALYLRAEHPGPRKLAGARAALFCADASAAL